MIVHRLAKAAHVALDGEGARLFGGRWNAAGRPAIYTAASPSLAVLEVLVHLDLPLELLPDDYRLLSIEIPDGVPVESLDATPADETASLAIGERFLTRGAALVLSAPSIIVPQERNVILNPRHEAMSGVRIVADDLFRFDPRLFKA